MDAQSIAYTLRNNLENCMYDLANGDEILADEYWNNPATLQDLLGDRLQDACNCLQTDDDEILAWETTDHLLKIGHEALKEATKNIKKRHGWE